MLLAALLMADGEFWLDGNLFDAAGAVKEDETDFTAFGFFVLPYERQKFFLGEGTFSGEAEPLQIGLELPGEGASGDACREQHADCDGLPVQDWGAFLKRESLYGVAEGVAEVEKAPGSGIEEVFRHDFGLDMGGADYELVQVLVLGAAPAPASLAARSSTASS